MSITLTRKKDALFSQKKEGLAVWYYLFPEYEIHYNEQAPGVEQDWHAHEQVHETIFVIEGSLTVKWKEDGQEVEKVLRSGDMVEVGDSMHSFVNDSDSMVKLLVLKRVPTNTNNRDILKNDKVLL